MQPTITSKKIIRSSLSQEQLSTETEMNKRKRCAVISSPLTTEWLLKFSDGTLTRVMEKLDHMVKDFHLFEYNKGMGGLGSGQRMTREEAKTSSQQSRKDYRSEGSIEVLKALLEDE
ncbi:hypothetical protein Tco_0011509 [Tanacetum coccineum]